VAGELPVTDAVINRVLGDSFAGSAGPVTGVRVHAADGDTLHVALSLQGVPMISRVPVTLTIDQQPVLPHSPVLGLTWSLAGLGALARIAAPFVTRVKRLPPGVRIDGDRVLVNVADLLRAQGLDEALRHMTLLQVHTRDGQVRLHFELRA
jgi:hypothetical protein